MSETLDISTISIIIAAASVVAGVLFALLQLRDLIKTRHMDMLMAIYQTWGSEDMKTAFGRFLGLKVADYDEFARKYGHFDSPERSNVWVDIDRIGWFWNGIGFLVHRKIAHIEMVDELFGYGATFVWDKMKPLVMGWRKRLNTPSSLIWFEYLYNKLKEREQKRRQMPGESTEEMGHAPAGI